MRALFLCIFHFSSPWRHAYRSFLQCVWYKIKMLAHLGCCLASSALSDVTGSSTYHHSSCIFCYESQKCHSTTTMSASASATIKQQLSHSFDQIRTNSSYLMVGRARNSFDEAFLTIGPFGVPLPLSILHTMTP